MGLSQDGSHGMRTSIFSQSPNPFIEGTLGAMHRDFATWFEQATREVAGLMSAAFDQAGIIDSAHNLASSGLRDGATIVREFLAHSETGLAYDHLRYMISEADLRVSDDCMCWLRSIALELGLPSNDDLA